MQPGSKVSQATAHLDGVTRQLNAAQAALPPIEKALAEEQKHIAKYSVSAVTVALNRTLTPPQIPRCCIRPSPHGPYPYPCPAPVVHAGRKVFFWQIFDDAKAPGYQAG